MKYDVRVYRNGKDITDSINKFSATSKYSFIYTVKVNGFVTTRTYNSYKTYSEVIADLKKQGYTRIWVQEMKKRTNW